MRELSSSKIATFRFGSHRLVRPVLAFMLLSFSVSSTGCVNLNYPDPPPTNSATTPPASSSSGPSASSASSPSTSPSTSPNAPERSEYGIREALPVEPADETLAWNDLTRLARGHRLKGELPEANTRLAQAALQLQDLSPGNASRQAVFSQRARLARELIFTGEAEAGELLADELFAEADAGPAIGGASLIDLARDTIERRAAETERNFTEEEELRLLSLSFRSAQAGTATRSRVNLSFEVASLALHLDQIELARDAIDQAVLDARTTNPLDLDQAASLKVYKSRIALVQGDLETAEAAATGAQRIFENIESNASSKAVAEAALADVLTARGETDRALEIARAGQARSTEEKLFQHADRTILGSLARAEAAAGLIEDARRHYREALAIPIEDSALDERLEASLRREFEALN